MATQYLQKFNSSAEIPADTPGARGIGAVGGNIILAGGMSLSMDPGKGNYWFVDTVNGDDTNNGGSGWSDALATIGKIFAAAEPLGAAAVPVQGRTFGSYDRIIFVGDIREQLVAPLGVYNVLIMGAPGIRPHDDNAARWRGPASPTAATALLKLREQGWILANFLMTGPADAAAVHLHRAEDATNPDGSHAQFLGMRFVAGLYGIQDQGGAHNILVDGCTFQSQVGANGGGIVCTSTAIAVPLRWEIRNCRFLDNQSNIIGPHSFGLIKNNMFDTATATQINTTDGGSQGGNTHVVSNHFNIAADDFDPAGGVTGLASDIWYNFLKNAVESGQPAN